MPRKEAAEWFFNPKTGTYTTRLKSDPEIAGTGASRGASCKAFLRACDDALLPNAREDYIIRGINPPE